MGFLRFKAISEFNQLAVLEVITIPFRKFQELRSPTIHTFQPRLHQ
jgi:hypothetical protein